MKAWKASLLVEEEEEEEEEEERESEGERGEEVSKGEEEVHIKKGEDFGYLLDMPMRNLTTEKKEKLLKNRDAKVWYFVGPLCQFMLCSSAPSLSYYSFPVATYYAFRPLSTNSQLKLKRSLADLFEPLSFHHCTPTSVHGCIS